MQYFSDGYGNDSPNPTASHSYDYDFNSHAKAAAATVEVEEQEDGDDWAAGNMSVLRSKLGLECLTIDTKLQSDSSSSIDDCEPNSGLSRALTRSQPQHHSYANQYLQPRVDSPWSVGSDRYGFREGKDRRGDSVSSLGKRGNSVSTLGKRGDSISTMGRRADSLSSYGGADAYQYDAVVDGGGGPSAGRNPSILRSGGSSPRGNDVTSRASSSSGSSIKALDRRLQSAQREETSQFLRIKDALTLGLVMLDYAVHEDTLVRNGLVDGWNSEAECCAKLETAVDMMHKRETILTQSRAGLQENLDLMRQREDPMAVRIDELEQELAAVKQELYSVGIREESARESLTQVCVIFVHDCCHYFPTIFPHSNHLTDPVIPRLTLPLVHPQQ